MNGPKEFDKNIIFNNLTEADILATKDMNDTISYCIDGSIVCTPTVTEKMTVEAESGVSYEGYLANFLKNCDINALCERYGAEEKDIPSVIAMAIFEEVGEDTT